MNHCFKSVWNTLSPAFHKVEMARVAGRGRADVVRLEEDGLEVLPLALHVDPRVEDLEKQR